MKNILIIPLVLLLSVSSPQKPVKAEKENTPLVLFTTTDSILQKTYDRAEALAFGNIVLYGNRQVMIEGAEYRSIWLETQPMGGAMYGKRNVEIARNNIEIFMEHQREDGRLPGVIYNREGIEPNYCQFQGFYLAMPAFETYFLLQQDKEFLRKVYRSLERFDAYLWKTRDSDLNGCLETWCIYDNGEDHSVRFNGFPKAWSFDTPPTKEMASSLTNEELLIHCKETAYDSTIEMTVPIESMDVMSYSYSCRDVLALISKELDNGKEHYWRYKANEVRSKIKSYLWDEKKHACYDKDKNNQTMPILLHNNLRCMYLGSFDQEMADRFIRFHLLNPDEFWTPMPLPSIAANDPAFQNMEGNNWSGQPQGLTYQRSIRALENYGHYAELTLLGKKFLDVIARSQRFTQQFDPFKAVSGTSKDGYGPSILTTLEFISRFHGIHISQNTVSWSAIISDKDYDYTQKWNNNVYRLVTQNGMAKCSINGTEILCFSKGARIVTDLKGNLMEVIGIEPEITPVTLDFGLVSYKADITPNSVYRVDHAGKLTLYKSVEFTAPEN